MKKSSDTLSTSCTQPALQMIMALGISASSSTLAHRLEHAFLNQRGYVTPEDVRTIALDVLRHRVGLTFEAEAENISTEQLITEIMDHVQVP
jgi:MoxR-like ATPase